MSNPTFAAFVAERVDDTVRRGVRELSLPDLGTDGVLIRTAWSSVNYKDGLATVAGGKVARLSPLVPGIDLVGTVVDPAESGLSTGAEVLVHGRDLGVAHHGGYSEYARVPAEWIVPLPPGLTARQAASLGTAGFTAALSVHLLEERGLRLEDGPVLVTGATGGVGSAAVAILAERGYEVVAGSGKPDAADWLRAIGASAAVERAEVLGSGKPMQRERWAAAVDCVGGPTLAAVLAGLRYGGAVAASGNTGGAELATTVFPFILRGVALLGVDSVACPNDLRHEVWRRLGTDLRPACLDELAATEVDLDGLEPALDRVLAGQAQGRTLVRLS